MRFLRRVLLWFGIAILALVGSFLLNVGVHRLPGPSAAQRTALNTLEVVRNAPTEGTNAFALLWLMRYDVSDADIERIAANDVREAEARVASGRSLEGLVPADRPLLEAPAQADPGLCVGRERGCLARVRANPAATRSLVARHARWIERMRMLEERDVYRYEFPLTLDLQLPTHALGRRLQLAALALAFSDGDRAGALAGVCRQAGAWRRLRQGTNSLIFSMMAVAHLDEAIDLSADMIAELPLDEPIPAACVAAFAPVAAADVDFCSEAAGEQAYAAATLDALIEQDHALHERSAAHRALNHLMLDPAQTSAMRAQHLAGYCSPEQRSRSLADDAAAPAPAIRPGPLACAANLVGCSTEWVGSAGIDRYRQRLLDTAARLRLGSTLLWLHETRDDPRPLAERFAARPDHLRSGTRATGIGDDGRSLWVANLDTQKSGERTTLALAPSAESAR